MKQFLITLLSVFLLSDMNAQLPNSDVWLFSYSVKSGNYLFTGGKNVSDHPGYDNQPFFSDDSALFVWTSERDNGQTDICGIFLPFGLDTFTVLTKTPESEYSPQYHPGKHFFLSAVVVEKDSTQRLWRYDFIDAGFDPKLGPLSKTIMTPLLPNVKQVAYSRWYNDSIVFLCLLPEPMNLFVANVNSQVISKCAMNVNRSMCVYHQKNHDLFLYSQMKADSSYAIQALSNTGAHVSDFESIPFVKGSQDFSIDKKGNIFMASGTKLFIWTIGKSKEWKEIGDFASQGLHKITRLAMSPDGKHIALVDNTK